MKDEILKPSYKSATFYARSVVTAASLLAGVGIIKPQTAEVVKSTADTIEAMSPQIVQVVQTIVDGIVQLVGLITGAVIMLRQGKEQTEIKTAYIEAARKKV